MTSFGATYMGVPTEASDATAPKKKYDGGGKKEIMVMHPAAMLKSLAQQADDRLSPSQ